MQIGKKLLKLHQTPLSNKLPLSNKRPHMRILQNTRNYNKKEQNHLIHSVSCRLINKGLPISSCSICQIQRKNRLTMITQ